MTLLKAALVVAALAAAVVPTSASWVESIYAFEVYPAVQRRLTAGTNVVPFALLDPLGVLLAIVLLVRWSMKLVRTGERWRSLAAVASEVAAAAALFYLLFLALWGLNYRRVPLADQLAFDTRRVTGERLASFSRDVVNRLNALHAHAHAAGWPGLDRTGRRVFVDRYGPGFHRALRQLRAPRTAQTAIVPGIPKSSILTWYFRRAGIDGMTNPYLLEIIVNGDLLPFERPFVVAHEWAHLAGYAAEDDASFVGWLTCLRGDESAEYSAWLFLYPHLLENVDGPARADLARQLADGPRSDLGAIRRRLSVAVPAVQDAAGRVYDRYLKANRVEEGVESYNRVVTLVLGTRFDAGWTPVLAQ
jgi:hypothetical protein